MMARRVSAVFEWDLDGRLKAVFLNADNPNAQDVLEKSLDRLLKPAPLNWLKRTLSRCSR